MIDVALQKGVNFLSETIIFTIGGTIVVYEYRKAEQKNLEKSIASAAKEKIQNEILDQRFQDIHVRIAVLEDMIKEEHHVIVYTYVLFNM
jgi:hypothetical protein